MTGTKICMLYYKNILDECIYRFFDLYSSDFGKTETGRYAFAGTMNKKRLFDIFKALVAEQIRKYTSDFDISRPKYYFIIGGCVPRENLLFKIGQGRLSEKLEKLIRNKPNIKYIFAETDIEIDLPEINQIFDDVFNWFFQNRHAFEKTVIRHNVFMIRHRKLGCHAVFKILKYIFGNANCVNIYMDFFEKKKATIISVNELIERRLTGQRLLNKLPEFASSVDEIRKYSYECINSI